MSLIFNHLPANVTRALADHATREHRTLEQVAIDALERGLAFSAPSSSEDDAADTLWAESPQFDEALKTFAEMEKQ